jgi:hypothetical protein
MSRDQSLKHTQIDLLARLLIGQLERLVYMNLNLHY